MVKMVQSEKSLLAFFEGTNILLFIMDDSRRAPEMQVLLVSNGRRINETLHSMGFRLKGNRKTDEGEDHPDGNKQSQQINDRSWNTWKTVIWLYPPIRRRMS